jgi:hypothetical protein
MTIRLPELYDTYEQFINDLWDSLDSSDYIELTRSEYFLDRDTWKIMRNLFLRDKWLKIQDLEC